MTGFTLLWSKILLSSLWVGGSKEDKIVWITMLALKDSDGMVQASVPGLAKAAGVTEEECRQVLQTLLSPDPDDTSGVEEGRRIRVVPGGWQIVNNELYRFSTADRREFWRMQKAEQRAKKEAAAQAREEKRKLKQNKPTGPEMTYDRIFREQGKAAADAWQDRQQNGQA